jgi:hypothetical protein
MSVTSRMFILCAAFTASVLVRLPNVNRPLSKHHEFAVAVILNGIISWKEAGGASVFHYVPLMTYQGEENRLLERGPFTDANGNQVYLSLGPGWYVLPYIVFTILHLPFNVLSLQILNFFLHLLTVFALYRSGNVLMKRYSFLSPLFPLITCIVFLFIPGPLWYFGNGYVHAAVSVPFAILLFTQFLKWTFKQDQFTYLNASLFFIYGFLGIYMDWFSCFLLAVMAVTAIFHFVRDRSLHWLLIAMLCGFTVLVSVGAIFLQFVSLLGWHNVVEYWTERAGDRSLSNEDASLLTNLISFAANMVSCAGVILICSFVTVAICVAKKKILFPLLPVLLWTSTCVLYNGIFFNWSYVHEFSMVPLCVLLSMLTAFLLLHILPQRRLVLLLSGLTFINLIQYYLINPPGNTSRVGTPYNAQQRLGKQIDLLVPKGYRIFSTLSNDPMVEYYAHRSFTFSPIENAAAAQAICDSLHIQKAVWLKIDSWQMKEVRWLK